MKQFAVRLSSLERQTLPPATKSNQTSMEEALADLVKALWPVDTGPNIQREFGVSKNDARRIMEGRASKRHIYTVLRHPKGEYAVGLYLLARVIGRDLEPYLLEEARIEDRLAREEASRRERLSRLHTRVSDIGLSAA